MANLEVAALSANAPDPFFLTAPNGLLLIAPVLEFG